MADHVKVPIKIVQGDRWGQLSFLGETHYITGETVKEKDCDFSSSGGHRVRMYVFKKNVQWKVPQGVPLDIADVAPASAPRRVQRH
jgi:hypothetical protein